MMTDRSSSPIPSHQGGALRSIDALDDAYLAAQDDIAHALAVDDPAGASRAAVDAGALRAIDADGRVWRVMAPLPTAQPSPHYRYRYRHQMSEDGEHFWNVDRFRFADHVSLADTYARRISDRGWLNRAIQGAEAAGYVAIAMVGLGLWLLLGDVIGSLPGIVVLGLMIVTAAALWWVTVALSDARYREATRLAQLTRLAAIGVTGAVAWIATIDVDSASTATRVLLCATVVLVAAGGSFARRHGLDTWTIAVGAWLVAAISASIVISEVSYADPDRIASAQLGALVGATLAFPIATRFARTRWVPIGIPAIGLVAAWALLGTMASSPRDLHTVLVVVGGAAAAASAFASGGDLHRQLRSVHHGTSYVLGALTLLVAVTQGPWDALFDWLEDIPLPVVLVVGGSAVLIGVGLIIRTAMQRVSGTSE